MLRLNFAHLPQHEQKLYQLIASALAVGFVVGLLWVLLGFSDQRSATENEWQASVLPQTDDAAAQFIVVSQKPRWFTEAGAAIAAAPAEDPLKALEGKPESLRLTGLVAKGDKTYALFLPLIAPAGSTTKPAIRQLTEGDTLVGDWVVKHISHNQVEIQQGNETQTLKMYQPKAK
ncbi:hypothetical protein [Cellvibrio sp. OA-2007]|uniref:hypothetical protein n=1 Tax=Cellvibrio sp. OA-2007 TaxID=529823 RepID=UPI000784FD62|nr:hypothetical protein [Cellvibrio sp. OA-2007]